MDKNLNKSLNESLIRDIVKRVISDEKSTLCPNAEEKKFKTSDMTVVSENIKLDTANELIKKVMKKASEMGVNAVCAITDTGARPVSVQSADGAFIASYDIALGKAYTAVSLKMKTSELKLSAQSGGSLYGIQHTNGGKIVIFGGGVPLKINDKLVGGFGVSGGTEEQDTFLGEYAEEVFKGF